MPTISPNNKIQILNNIAIAGSYEDKKQIVREKLPELSKNRSWFRTSSHLPHSLQNALKILIMANPDNFYENGKLKVNNSLKKALAKELKTICEEYDSFSDKNNDSTFVSTFLKTIANSVLTSAEPEHTYHTYFNAVINLPEKDLANSHATKYNDEVKDSIRAPLKKQELFTKYKQIQATFENKLRDFVKEFTGLQPTDSSILTELNSSLADLSKAALYYSPTDSGIFINEQEFEKESPIKMCLQLKLVVEKLKKDNTITGKARTNLDILYQLGKDTFVKNRLIKSAHTEVKFSHQYFFETLFNFPIKKSGDTGSSIQTYKTDTTNRSNNTESRRASVDITQLNHASSLTNTTEIDTPVLEALPKEAIIGNADTQDVQYTVESAFESTSITQLKTHTAIENAEVNNKPTTLTDQQSLSLTKLNIPSQLISMSTESDVKTVFVDQQIISSPLQAHKTFIINANNFRLIKDTYLDILNNVEFGLNEQGEKVSILNPLIECIESLEFDERHDQAQVTIPSAYSKTHGEIGYNISGDVSFQIKSKEETVYFCFDAPSSVDKEAAGGSWAILRSIGDPNNKGLSNDACITQHAQFIYLLLALSNKLENHHLRPTLNHNSTFITNLDGMPLAWIIKPNNKDANIKAFVSGDCNILLIHNGRKVYLNAGIIKMNGHIIYSFIKKFSEYYRNKEYKIKTVSDIDALQLLSEEYRKSTKSYSNSIGGTEDTVEIQQIIQGQQVELILLTDGITDSEKPFGLFENTERLWERYRDKTIIDNISAKKTPSVENGRHDDIAYPLGTMVEFVIDYQTINNVNQYNLAQSNYKKLEFIATLSGTMAKYANLRIDNHQITLQFSKPEYTVQQIQEDFPVDFARSLEINQAINEYDLTKSLRNFKQSNLTEIKSILHIDAQNKEEINFSGAQVRLKLPIDDSGDHNASISTEIANNIFKEIESGNHNVLVVNCQGGMSRSSAVNFALAYIYGQITLEKITQTVSQVDAERSMLIQCNPITFNSIVDAANKRYGLQLDKIHHENYYKYRALDYKKLI